LTGLCLQDACSNSTLSPLITNVTNGCSGDLDSLGFSSEDAFTVISSVQAYYPTARSLVCLQKCVTTLNILLFVLILTIRNLMTIVSNVMGGNVNASVIPQFLICLDCTKAAVMILNENVPGFVPDHTQSYLTSTRGLSFTDGTTPSTIA
ncbi:hypothetical protein PENSPDRAFT_589280, partial [Peniophora sp. CONT]